MKRSIQVTSQAEGDALVRALDDPIVRATVTVSGILAELPTLEQRRSVISFVLNTVAAQEVNAPSPGPPLRLHDAAAGLRVSSGE